MRHSRYEGRRSTTRTTGSPVAPPIHLPRGRASRAMACCLLLLVTCVAPAIADEEIEQRLSALLRSASTGTALVVEEAASGAPVFSRNGDRLLKPASVQKLFTTAAAIERFGPDFAFETRVFHSASQRELWVIGAGDPAIGDERIETRDGRSRMAFLDDWAGRLRGLGVHTLDRIVVDDSIFDGETTHPDWPADQYLSWYQAPCGGLNLNDNCLDVRAVLSGGAVRLTLVPELSDELFESTLRPGPRHAPRLHRSAGADVFELSGTLARSGSLSPAACGNPTIFFGFALAEGLRKRGIAVGPEVVRRRFREEQLSSATAVAVHRTPLRDVLWRANTFSQNLFADCLLKALAAYGRDGRRTGTPGGWTAGADVLVSTLRPLGVDMSSAAVRDGSGLSPTNRASAAQVARLLTAMHRHPHGSVFRESLAAPGVEGTMRRRMTEPVLARAVRAKTGTLREVSTLAGYVSRPDGRVFSFALLMNGNPSPELGTRVCRVLAGVPEPRR